MARNVAANIPPNTPVPMEFRLAAPAPEATTSGNTPRIKAIDVMITLAYGFPRLPQRER